MNGGSFIKIYIKHIQNICKEKIPCAGIAIRFIQDGQRIEKSGKEIVWVG